MAAPIERGTTKRLLNRLGQCYALRSKVMRSVLVDHARAWLHAELRR